MKRGLHSFLFLLSLCVIACGCSKKKDRFDERVRIEATLCAIAPEPYEWESGEILSVFNDQDTENTALELEDRCATMQLDEHVEQLFVLSPYSSASASGPSRAVVTVPEVQTQSECGRIGRGRYPMRAAAPLLEGMAVLHFSPLATLLSLEVFKSSGGDPEQVRSVRMVPSGNTGFVGKAVVDLTEESPSFREGDSGAEAVSVNLSAPADLPRSRAEAASRRLFIVLARQEYGAMTLEIQTTRSLYSLSLTGKIRMDGVGRDVLPLSIDLGTGQVVYSLSGTEQEEETTRIQVSSGDFSALGIRMPADTLTVDIIPDFSRVGYHYGDRAITTPAVRRTISVEDILAGIAAGTAADTTDFIQKALDEVGTSGGGTVLLKNGVYNTSRTLFVDYDNLVLRGESEEGTVIRTIDTKQRQVISLGKSMLASQTTLSSKRVDVAGRAMNISHTPLGSVGDKTVGTTYCDQWTPVHPSRVITTELSPIMEDHVPVGRMYVKVADPSHFAPGDRVVIYRKATENWIHDIWMDRIAWNGRTAETGGTTIQWNENLSSRDKYWERRIVAISGNLLYFDAPVVMALDAVYGGGSIRRMSWDRVRESGVENLTLEAAYDEGKVYTAEMNKTYAGQPYDEAHAWSAVYVHAAEHCWVRNVTSRHMGMSLAWLGGGARCVTVLDCKSLDPVSVILGSRRYAFEISGGELILIKNCYTLYDRHSFVSGGVCGPNVYTNCRAERPFSSIGPHQNWATGSLFDRVSSSGAMEAQDAGNGGTGHGWRGANIVYWNCEGSILHCQSPQASARNFAIGFVGTKGTGSNYNNSYFGAYVDDPYMQEVGYITVGGKRVSRPDGEWYPALDYLEKGTQHIALPHDGSGKDWWPRLTLTSFSDPLSLYECQLEDRHARGIWLGDL